MIEEKLGLESYFEKERFGQREDGFYCLKAPTKVNSLLKRVPNNSIRTKNYHACPASRVSLALEKRKCQKKQIKNWRIFIPILIKNLSIFIARNSVGCRNIWQIKQKNLTHFLNLYTGENHYDWPPIVANFINRSHLNSIFSGWKLLFGIFLVI